MFQVESSTQQQSWYTVRFDAPSCSCMSWEHNHLPCKHFFAVFKHHSEWGWEKLPLAYRCSPTLTLDEDVIPQQDMNQEIGLNTVTESSSADANVDATTTPQLSSPCEKTTFKPAADKLMPVRKSNQRSVGSECSEILNEIRKMTYLVSDYESLCTLKKELITVDRNLKEACPSDSGLLLEATSEPQAKKRKTEQVNCKNREIQGVDSYSKIPM